MKIVFYSRLFYPTQGGSVSIVDQLSDAWSKNGHEVVVVTPTSVASENEPDKEPFSYGVVRQPNFKKFWSLLNNCDALVMMEMSLKALIPALLLRKKCLVTHQTWCFKSPSPGELSWTRRLQRFFLPSVIQVPCSKPIGENWGGKFYVVGNPYQEQIFRDENLVRRIDFCFVGRLVNDKGVDLFLEALALQKKNGWVGRATIVGEGFERDLYQQLAAKLGLKNCTEFMGWQSPIDTASVLNQSSILVVPSRWEEPFGMVAVEGLACGCRLVVSAGGGLPEAAGSTAEVFQNGSLEQLSNAMNKALQLGTFNQSEKIEISAHLEGFRASTVAEKYVDLLDQEG